MRQGTYSASRTPWGRLSCGQCVRRAGSVPAQLPGVLRFRVPLLRGRNVQAHRDALEFFGYRRIAFHHQRIVAGDDVSG